MAVNIYITFGCVFDVLSIITQWSSSTGSVFISNPREAPLDSNQAASVDNLFLS